VEELSMTHAVLSLRPSAVSVRLSEDNPKIVELQFISNGLSMTIDVPRTEFEVLTAKWSDLTRREEAREDKQLGLFRRAP
jgi:hypothetical protein